MTLLVTIAGSFIIQGCAATVPLRPVPKPDSRQTLPAWYPEKAWTKHVGDRIYLEGKVIFDTNKSVILPGGEQILAQLIDYMKANSDISRIRLEGHTDSRASEEYNQGLGARRAVAVANWLVDRGVDHMRLLAVSFGETRPIGPNDTAPGRQENRRAAFHVAEINGSWFLGEDPAGGGLVLEVMSKAEREAMAKVGEVPVYVPPPFHPEGNVIKPFKRIDKSKVKSIKLRGQEPADDPPADAPADQPAEPPPAVPDGVE